MDSIQRTIPFAFALLVTVRAQESSDAAPSPTNPIEAGKASDSAPGSSRDPDSDDTSDSGSTSLVNYYFVFLALIICVAVLGAFLIWQRRRRAALRLRGGRGNLGTVGAPRWPGEGRNDGWQRRYLQGRWRSQEDVGREEGLNELGEAPPAYAPPKTREEEQREAVAQEEPALPMQTLSREDTGLKPPDYTHATTQAIDDPGRHSLTSTSSRPPNGEHGAYGEPSRT